MIREKVLHSLRSKYGDTFALSHHTPFWPRFAKKFFTTFCGTKKRRASTRAAPFRFPKSRFKIERHDAVPQIAKFVAESRMRGMRAVFFQRLAR